MCEFLPGLCRSEPCFGYSFLSCRTELFEGEAFSGHLWDYEGAWGGGTAMCGLCGPSTCPSGKTHTTLALAQTVLPLHS